MYLYAFIYWKTQYYKMSIVSKFIYRLNAVTIKMTAGFNGNRKADFETYVAIQLSRLANNLMKKYKVQKPKTTKLNIKHKYWDISKSVCWKYILT